MLHGNMPYDLIHGKGQGHGGRFQSLSPLTICV